MTEKQMKQLQGLLAQSNPDKPSEELDQRILMASKEHLSAQAIANNQPQSLAWLKNITSPLGFIRSATIALSLTLAIFLGMGQLLKFDHSELLAIKNNGNDRESIDINNADFVTSKPNQQISKPIPQLVAKAPSQAQRDSFLMESISTIGLPDTSDLLETMVFDLASDRSSAQASINLAMDDIRSMIHLGDFNDARERYVKLKRVQLKQHCPPCGLPDSLDDLLIAQSASILNTG
jgi:hypothetical protein